jgi:hypothetical protein
MKRLTWLLLIIGALLIGLTYHFRARWEHANPNNTTSESVEQK